MFEGWYIKSATESPVVKYNIFVAAAELEPLLVPKEYMLAKSALTHAIMLGTLTKVGSVSVLFMK